MKKILIIALILIVYAPMLFASGERDTLYIVNTTDIHGTIIPYDYIKDEPGTRGMVKVYTRMKEFKEKYDNVIFVDCGDLLQGTPMHIILIG